MARECRPSRGWGENPEVRTLSTARHPPWSQGVARWGWENPTLEIAPLSLEKGSRKCTHFLGPRSAPDPVNRLAVLSQTFPRSLTGDMLFPHFLFILFPVASALGSVTSTRC